MNLTDQQKQWLAWGIIAIVVTLISTFLGVKYPIPEPPPFVTDEEVILGTTHFTNLEAEDITATDDLVVTDDATIGGDTTLTGALTAAAITGSGTATFSGIADVGTFLNLSEQTAISVTAASIITPTGTYQPLTSAAAVTTSTSCAVYTGTNTGDIVIFCNENASDAIIIDDGANTAMGGNKTLTGGEGDCLALLWDGTDWVAALGYNDN